MHNLSTNYKNVPLEISVFSADNLTLSVLSLASCKVVCFSLTYTYNNYQLLYQYVLHFYPDVHLCTYKCMISWSITIDLHILR